MPKKPVKEQYFIVPIKPLEGNDTAIETWCNDRGEGATIYAIYKTIEDGTLTEIDNGYRSYDEAKHTWPQAN